MLSRPMTAAEELGLIESCLVGQRDYRFVNLSHSGYFKLRRGQSPVLPVDFAILPDDR